MRASKVGKKHSELIEAIRDLTDKVKASSVEARDYHPPVMNEWLVGHD